MTDLWSLPFPELRDRIISPDDRDMHLCVGFFLSWYATVEFVLTNTLSVVSRNPDPAMFHILVKGMDARVKIQRLRQASKLRRLALGPNFSSRLTFFEEKIVPLRNKIAHQAIVHNQSKPYEYLLIALDALPWEEFKMGKAGERRPEPIPAADLLADGAWLRALTHDLRAVNERAVTGETLEIENPRSAQPNEYPANPPKRDGRAKSHKRD